MERPAAAVALVLAIGCLTALPSLGSRDLWNPDEPRYAEVAREMRVLGDFLVPHLNGAIYAQKPPLFFWLSAALQEAGAGFEAGRIVTAILATGSMLLTWALARLWFSARAALLAALVLGTTELFAWLSRFGVLDVPLTFFTTLSAYGWFRGGRALVLFYAGMALAVLTKGPVGAVVPLLGVAAAAAARLPRRPRPARHALWGVPLALGIVAAWVVPACIHGGREYADTILFRQNVGRMVQSWSHPRPFWYYVPNFAGNFFPWILLVPPAAVWAWRQGREERPLRALLLWFAFGFLFFSALSGKRERYLLPIFAPMALVVARFVEAGLPLAWGRRLARVAHRVLFGAGVGLVLFAFLGVWGLGKFEGQEHVADAFRGVSPVPLALAGSAVAALAWVGRRTAVAFLAVEVLALFLAIDLFLVPRIDAFKSPRPVARLMNEWAPEGGDNAVATYRDTYAGAYNLYSGRVRIEELGDLAALDAFLAGPGRRLVLTDEEVDREHLAERISTPHHRREIQRVGHRHMIFLTNFEPPP
jgi:4-amino-4-deoxy-L-arabinose transferase-like glycosyltransferase